MVNAWFLLIPLAIGLAFGFMMGKCYPLRQMIDAAWRAGWRASDGGMPPLNAEALADEKSA